MKKLILCSAVITVFLFGVATPNASAYNPYFTGEEEYEGEYVKDYGGYKWDKSGSPWSGYFIGLFDVDDSEQEILAAAEGYLGEKIPGYAIAKVDGEAGTNSFLTTTVNENGLGLDGLWWSSNAGYMISFYSVKAAEADWWALYYVYPYEETEGYWSTIHIPNSGGQQPTILHLSALASEGAPVPEPSTMLLLGFGLIGLAGFGREKLFKKS